MSTEIVNYGSHQVSLADSLNGPFIAAPFLYCDRLEKFAGPDVDVCSLSYVYGSFVVREDGGAGGQYDPLDLDRKYVRVTFFSPSGALVDRWYGVIEVDENNIEGRQATVRTGNQMLTAYGLLRLLERTVIRTSVVQTGESDLDTETIGRGIGFNIHPHGQFPTHGNAGGSVSSRVFAGLNGEVWNAEQCVDYLLENHSPTNSNGDELATWTLGGTTGAINWYDPTVQTDRRTVKEVLDDLIDRRRGVGYYVSGQEGPAGFTAEIVAFTFTDSTVFLTPPRFLPANQNAGNLEVDSATDVLISVLRKSSLHVADLVRVEGDWITSTFSVPFSPHSDGLTTGWEEDKEADYRYGASNTDGYEELDEREKEKLNQIVRQRDDLRDVFSRFVLHPEWDQTVRDLSTPSERSFNVSPNMDALEHEVPQDQITNIYEGTSAPLWLQGKRFLRYLPLLVDAGNPELEYRDPFVLFRTDEADSPENAVWEYGDRLAANSGDEGEEGRRFSVSVEMLESAPGIRLLVNGASQHFIAAADWEDAADTNPWDDPSEEFKNHAVDFRDLLVATVTLEMDERVHAEFRLSTPPAGQQDRELTIHVPDARLDMIVPGTITDIDDAGNLVAESDGRIVRDDRERLETIAKVAAQWYGQPRQALQLVYRQLNPHNLQLGHLVTSLGAFYPGVNSAITSIKYDVLEGTTAIETSFADLDLVNVI